MSALEVVLEEDGIEEGLVTVGTLREEEEGRAALAFSTLTYWQGMGRSHTVDSL